MATKKSYAPWPRGKKGVRNIDLSTKNKKGGGRKGE